MIRLFIIAALIITVLYLMEFDPIVIFIHNAADYWNTITIHISTFRHRHPWIMLSFPFTIILLLMSMKEKQ